MDMNIEMDKIQLLIQLPADWLTQEMISALRNYLVHDTPKTAASTTRLSRVGIATPCCHLYTACGVANPNISARSFTERPALILSLVMFIPVAAISIVGIVIIFPPVPAVSQHLPNSRAVQAVLL